MLFKKDKPSLGSVVYELTVNNTITEWVVSEISKDKRGTCQYMLSREDGRSFYVCEEKDLGKSVFSDYKEAFKEKERRMYETRRKA